MTKNRWIAAGAGLVVVLALLTLALVAGGDAEPDRRAAPTLEVGVGDDGSEVGPEEPTGPVGDDLQAPDEPVDDGTPTTDAPAPAPAPRPEPSPTTTTTTPTPTTNPPGTTTPPAVRPDCRETTTADATVRVCVGRAAAGSPVTFTVEASGRLRDDCGSPVPDFGDGTDMAVCAIGCESLPPDAVKFERTYEHTYAEGGRYTARFHFPGCGEDSGKDLLVAPIEVHVEGASS